MDKMLLVINWILYGMLFAAFFIKYTDQKSRNFARKIVYGLLMLYCLFFSVTLFKSAFMIDGESRIKIGVYQTIFNFMILIFMCTKVIDDNLFKKLKR
jgi:hypothetical protein